VVQREEREDRDSRTGLGAAAGRLRGISGVCMDGDREAPTRSRSRKLGVVTSSESKPTWVCGSCRVPSLWGGARRVDRLTSLILLRRVKGHLSPIHTSSGQIWRRVMLRHTQRWVVRLYVSASGREITAKGRPECWILFWLQELGQPMRYQRCDLRVQNSIRDGSLLVCARDISSETIQRHH